MDKTLDRGRSIDEDDICRSIDYTSADGVPALQFCSVQADEADNSNNTGSMSLHREPM